MTFAVALMEQVATGRDMPIGRRSGGFAYVALLLAIALIGLAASTSISLGSTMARRDAEQQLLFVGMEFQRALRSYAGVSEGATAAVSAPARGPRTLEELLRDPRAPGVRRHLRQLYADPLSGRNEWGTMRDSQGYITGVYSLAGGQPIQRSGFELPLAHFENAETYRQWVFGLPMLR